MAQNEYSVSLKIGNPNKSGECKIYVRIFGGGKDIKIPTSVFVLKSEFTGRKVVGNPLSDKINAVLEGEIIKTRQLILDAKIQGVTITPSLFDLTSNKTKLSHYRKKYLDSIRNENTKRGFGSVLNKIPDVTIKEIGQTFLNDLEKMLWDNNLDINTVHSQMKRMKTFFLHLIDKEIITNGNVVKSLSKYHVPNYIQKIPEYLTEKEIQDLFTLVRIIGNPTKKTHGYYFLLSCFTGWRLSDLLSFNYEKRVREDILILRAGKNNKIVSILIYPELREVLEYCKNHPVNTSEKEFRLSVKDLAKDIGINQIHRNIKIHTGRHSFAMRMIGKGFSIDEVAELIGDSKDVARVYARITNTHINGKIRERLF